jgi:hypothetical protein
MLLIDIGARSCLLSVRVMLPSPRKFGIGVGSNAGCR